MFGENQRRGPAYYRDAPEAKAGKLKATEVFYTLQGEGPFSGHPAVFVRLTHCHLACHFCFPGAETIDTVNRGRIKLNEVQVSDTLPTMHQGQLTETKVVGVSHRQVSQKELWRLVVRSSWADRGQPLVTTYDHLFMNMRGDWQAASLFKPGDKLVGWRGGHRPFEVLESARASAEDWQRATQFSRCGYRDSATVVSLKCAPHPFHLYHGALTHNCDTMFDEGQWFSPEELWEEVQSKLGKARLVVVTGGEPLLQAPNLKPFIEKCQGVGLTVQVETAGNLSLHGISGCGIVVSPKIAGKKHVPPHPSLLTGANRLYLKFPVDADPESPYHQLPEWVSSLHVPTYLTPINCYLRKPLRFLQKDGSQPHEKPASFWEEGMLDMHRNRKNHEYAATLCLKHGYLLSLQTHLYASIP